MLILLEFLLIFPVIESQFRVYHSHYPVLNNDHDCFYRFERSSSGRARHLVSYCIRSNSTYSNEKCFGTPYTYKELRLTNISTTQLFQWFAPIDMIDDYAAYLLSDIENSFKEQIYCECMDYGSFGKSCQYRFYLEYDELSFDEIVYQTLLLNTFHEQENYIRSIYLLDEQNFAPCYTLFNCITWLGFCLDWREINDGIQHCIDGKDEQDFVSMELTDCDLRTEYRCRNGLCIPRSFLFDRSYDCQDWYDEQYLEWNYDDSSTLTCWSKTGIAECEEHRFGLSFFSCGDGERIPASWLDHKSCENLRDNLMVKALFRPYLNQTINNRCYDMMFHLFRLHCLFSKCWDKLTDDQFLPSFAKNDNICPDWFFFPPGPFVFSFVRLLYKSYDWETNCIRPDFICWNQTFCNIYQDEKVFEFEAFHCLPIEYFGVLLEGCVASSYRSFTSLVLIVQTLFSHCTEKNTNSTLYKCLNHMAISPHRLMDAKFSDCAGWNSNQEDEMATNHTHMMMICQLPDRFSCDDYYCIPRLAIQDGFPDCGNGRYMDEVFAIGCVGDFGCQYLREINLKNIIPLINYQELCNSFPLFENSKFYSGGNDTDETDCEMWPCRARYMHCDGVWQRPNGCDELNCLSSPTKICEDNEHPCAFFNSTIIGCLPLAKAGDGQFDCLFGGDERRTLLKFSSVMSSPEPTTERVYYRLICWNHFDKDIFGSAVCDGVIDCPLGDDEFFCDWQQYSTCAINNYQFACKNGTCISKSRQWCNGIIDCYPEGEDERLCDILTPFTLIRSGFRKSSYSPLSFNGLIQTKRGIISKSSNTIQCHRGILIEDKMTNNYICLCPSSYYGSYCEFQSERLTISYRIERPFNSDENVIYRFVFYLVDQNSDILTFETMICAVFNEELMLKQLIYLNYPRIIKTNVMFNNKFVRIDSYYVSNDSIQVSPLSWFYSVQFSSFLPVTRLAALLYLEEELQNRTTYCQNIGKCQHGVCQLFINSAAAFCRCDEGWTGLMCDEKLSSQLCEKLNCSRQFSRCITYNKHAFCMCTLGRIGPKCELPFDACSSIHYQNNGTCLSLDERTIQQVCQCSPPYFGPLCQYSSAQLKLNINRNLSYFPLLIVHFLYPPPGAPGVLFHRKLLFFRNIHPNTQLIINDTRESYLAPLIFVQLFFDSNQYNDSYYLLSISNTNRSHLTTQIEQSYRCPHVNEYLNSTLINQNWLKRIKFYHLYLKNVKCFYDEVYLCLVDNNQIPDCLTFNHNVANCTERNYCENGGRCFQRKQTGQLEYACICPQCTAGNFCQIQMNQFSLTLDSMLGQTILIDRPLHSQPAVIKVLLTLISIMFMIGLISNVCSFVTFRPATSRKNGCGTYLLILSIVNQITLCVFATRVIYLLHSQMVVIINEKLLRITCFLFDFILQVCVSFCDWLPVCIAYERTISVIQGIGFDVLLSKRRVKIVLPILVVTAISTSIHQVFSHDLVADPHSNDRRWCVIKHRQAWLRTYEILINLLNNFVPIIINFILSTLLLVRLSSIRQKSHRSNQETYWSILFAHIKGQKELLIAPLVMIIAKLPLLIVSVAIKCISKQWHLYLSIIAYTLSLLPLTATFLIFVWPSSTFMRVFKAYIKRHKPSTSKQSRTENIQK